MFYFSVQRNQYTSTSQEDKVAVVRVNENNISRERIDSSLLYNCINWINKILACGVCKSLDTIIITFS